MPFVQIGDSQRKKRMSLVAFVKTARIQGVAIQSSDYLKELLSKGLGERSKKETVRDSHKDEE